MKWIRNISIASVSVILIAVIKLLIPKPSSHPKIDYSNATTKKDSVAAMLKAYPEKLDIFCNAYIHGDTVLFYGIKKCFSKGLPRRIIDSAFQKDLEYLPYPIKERILTILDQGSNK